MEMNNDIFTPDLPIPEPVSFEDAPIPTPVEEETPAAAPPPRRRRKADAPVLTIESGDEIETEDAREAAAWHEIHNAYRTRRILSAPLGGIEQTDSGKTIAVVDYNGFRIVIPLKEMMVMPNAANSTESMVVRQMKLLGNMLGAEIDFVILGIDSKTRSVVASRREAMMRKRQPRCQRRVPRPGGARGAGPRHCRCRQVYPCRDFRRGVFHHGTGSGMGLDWGCP